MADPTLKELLAGSSLSFAGTVRGMSRRPVSTSSVRSSPVSRYWQT